MTHQKYDRGWWLVALAGSLLLGMLAVGCTTGPRHLTVNVTVCVFDWEANESRCEVRRCDYDTETGEYDCLNKPVVG